MSAKLSLDTLSEWAQLTKDQHASEPNHASKLCFDLHRTKFVLNSEPVEYQKRTVIAFEVNGGKRVGVRKRHLLPAHFAVLRLLEIIPGMSLLLRDDQHRGQDLTTGRVRSEDEMIFNLAISISKPKAARLGILRATKLDRVLFDVSADTRLYERRSGDHRYITPSNFVPIRFRGEALRTQSDLVRAVESLVYDAPEEFSDRSPREIIDLLKSLLAIGNDLHWNELIDRLPDDARSFTATRKV